MSAEKEALEHLNQIFTIIKETLQDVNKERPNMRELTNEEKQSLSKITKNIQLVRSKLNKYLKSFRVQTSLDDF
jgi:vacuolar-type H+-ATPase subunit I/STV1|tara:strand:- start:3791 stop:4012 length:222 start_codon:yes stop_codon:yes gene_type:complete